MLCKTLWIVRQWSISVNLSFLPPQRLRITCAQSQWGLR